jgi:hypothetical protein
MMGMRGWPIPLCECGHSLWSHLQKNKCDAVPPTAERLLHDFTGEDHSCPCTGFVEQSKD